MLQHPNWRFARAVREQISGLAHFMPKAKAVTTSRAPMRKRFLSYLGRLTLATVVILLLGSGIWANVGKTPLSEMRGMWVTQAMRGMVY
jgi:hypothetical protein